MARSAPIASASIRVLLLATATALAGGCSGAAGPEPAVLSEAPTTLAASPADAAIVDVAVVDVVSGRVEPERTVLIREGLIDAVLGPGEAAESAAAEARERIDGRGGYLIPGLWDMHAHLRGNGLPEWVTTDWMMPLILAHGVTGVREMNSDCDGPEQGPVCLDRMKELRDEVEAGDRLGPRILALSSVQVNPPWDYDVTEEQARGMVAHYQEQGADFMKVYQRLSPEAFRWMAGEAADRGLGVAGHVPLRMSAAEAAESGLRSVEHARDFLFDCFPGAAEFRRTARSLDPPVSTMRAMVETHDPGRCDEAFRTLVANDTWYVPTHVTRRMDAMADDSTFRADPRSRWLPPLMWEGWNADADRMIALDPSPEGRAVVRSFYEKGLDITGAAHRAGVRMLVGTDGGDTFVFPGSGLHDELGELVKAGLSPAEALRAATVDAAEFLRLLDRHGTIEVGKHADLVLLDANPLDDIDHTRQIRAVFRGGRALTRPVLDDMLLAVEAAAGQPIGPGSGN